MQRRDLLKNSALALLGTTVWGSSSFTASPKKQPSQTAKNIIFMVSDGMSTGTLNMTDLFLQRKEGRRSHWLSLYDENKVRRALMDTASANSLVTDSAAASSSWGGGVRVPNGSLNVNADGSFNKPILQKFKESGKSVGCVTTVPITHATPAGFCVNNHKRGDMNEIASQYLGLRFDVMMGGGIENFVSEKRKDKQNLLDQYRKNNYRVFTDNYQLSAYQSDADQPVLGLFHEDGLPYQLDLQQNETLRKEIPSLSKMTAAAIQQLSRNKNGFVLQVESGKVDWAAHANDIGALIHEQVAFDDAVKVAVGFAEKDKNTLVVLTTDHGNANPGLFYGSKANDNFDRIFSFRHTNDWILNGITHQTSSKQLIERVEYAQGWKLDDNEAKELLKHYSSLDESGVYNPRKLPFKYLAQVQEKYTSVGWGSMDHSADYVELAMYGPGSEKLQPFIKNYELHNFLLKSAEVMI
ncbi:alkaline phosphatase [Gynurincola endophyticus]|uniref:alkaline phosphatase n=1 Tax=Gynurincola endophyticus TaxID=2479004 RepID=UPI000F8EED30|nr:alkaline phosphatase [Gynurincola endophyticus]